LEGLTRLEHEYVVPIPSRTGRQSSNRWRFQGYIDGFVVDENGWDWLVEFKLRTRLTPVQIVRRSRQIRFYAWARHKETGRRIAGVIVDERLNAAAKPVQIVGGKNKRPSETVAQVTTVRLYREACVALGTKPSDKMLTALGARTWGQRIAIPFRPSELEEAGRELVSAAAKIRDLDSGRRYPLRNAKAMICRFCDYSDICDNPTDDGYARTLFEFTVPKRERGLEPIEDDEGSNDAVQERRAA
jgi:CRISPR/Cas system-associated exonuclease Cas4 (RecB family)